MGKEFISNATEMTKEYYEEGKKAVQKGLHHPHGSGTLDDSFGNSLPAGTPHKINVGGRRIKITKLIDEGGFSYVLEGRDSEGRAYAIKRLCIQDAEMEKNALQEIQVMKKLKNCKYCIRIIGESVTMEGSQKTIYVLMEKAEGSLIDLLRKHAEHRKPISEAKILKIFHQIALAVEAMHRQDPSIQHRDLKIENVLKVGSQYKLCDFGSTTTRVYHLNTKRDRVDAEADIGKNTTMAYRSPEMCDMFSEFSINEKADVWALGCVLYKLAFFKGPFEEGANEGSFLSILNCKYKMPKNHNYSPDFISMIKKLLTVDVNVRPDIWMALDMVCKLRQVENNVTRPSNKKKPSAMAKPAKVETRKSNTTTTKKRKKKSNDLFDLLGEDVDDETPTKKSPQRRTQTRTPQKTPVVTKQAKKAANSFGDDWAQDFGNQNSDPFAADSNDWDAGFDDKKGGNDDWDADFSNDDWGKKPSNPTIKEPVNDLFDQLDWTSNATSSTTSKPKPKPQQQNKMKMKPSMLEIPSNPAHNRSKSDTNLFDFDMSTEQQPKAKTPSLIDFNAQQQERKKMKSNILDLMNQSQSGMNRPHSYDQLNQLAPNMSPHISPLPQYGNLPMNYQQYSSPSPQYSPHHNRSGSYGHPPQQYPPQRHRR